LLTPILLRFCQVYAPYLQRTTPMTDEEEEKQNKLFGKRCEFDLDQRLSIRDRIEISQRLHAPKLMSDMSAFKAANPGCIFEDFVSW
jgi:Rab3 GTPase-activating protein catalytic subunit